MSKLKDLTGAKFGRLTVLGRGTNDKYGRSRWICKCECGRVKLIMSQSLIRGNTVSCGCYKDENTSKRFRTHGLTETRLYSIWSKMKYRCENPNAKFYTRYGGRGICVCKEWHEFKKFYNWAVAHGYSEELTIDRINNDGNYEPSNCRWATVEEQHNNMSNNHDIEFNGKVQTAAQWSKETGISARRILKRLDSGWSTECALIHPIRKLG